MPFQYDRNNLGWGQDALKGLFRKQSSLRKWLDRDRMTYQMMFGQALERELSAHSREEIVANVRKLLRNVDVGSYVGAFAAILVCFGCKENEAKSLALAWSDRLSSASEVAHTVGEVWDKLSGNQSLSLPGEDDIRQTCNEIREQIAQEMRKKL